jgi:hypothetical protein
MEPSRELVAGAGDLSERLARAHRIQARMKRPIPPTKISAPASATIASVVPSKAINP